MLLNEKSRISLGFILGVVTPIFIFFGSFKDLQARQAVTENTLQSNTRRIDHHDQLLEKLSQMQSDIAVIKAELVNRPRK